MASSTKDKAFAEEMAASLDEIKMSSSTLDNAIEWIGSNLNPDEVFKEKDLESWAESNGYVKE